MVLSCLVEPLVSPLTGRGTSGPGRRSTLERSRLLSTALACTALLALSSAGAVGGTHETPDRIQREPVASVARNAHRKPNPIPYSHLLSTVFTTSRRDHAPSLREAPKFEQAALEDRHRLTHKRDIVRETGPGLGLGLRIDRLHGGLEKTFLRFGSGQHLSGLPTI